MRYDFRSILYFEPDAKDVIGQQVWFDDHKTEGAHLSSQLIKISCSSIKQPSISLQELQA